MGSLAASFDMKRYGRLLAKAAPCVITNSAEHERAISNVEGLIERGERNMSPEEDALLDLLTNLIREYERTIYPPFPKSAPHEILEFLLEQRGATPSALWPVIGSKSRVSEILSGKRSISKEQAKKLAEFFHVGVALFI
jgi:HTH-type transcriptional regulator/antitoxin HigA